MAITGEQEALWGVEYAVIMSAWSAGGGKGKKPKPRDYPVGTAAEEAKRARVLSQAKAFQAKRRSKT
ncbi:hypothetical protein PJL15_00083 [Paenarthrobacter nitroguajacolicus]|nr:hypothetical protein [Paenarthrobacter nitroguajacolicus]